MLVFYKKKLTNGGSMFPVLNIVSHISFSRINISWHIMTQVFSKNQIQMKRSENKPYRHIQNLLKQIEITIKML